MSEFLGDRALVLPLGRPRTRPRKVVEHAARLPIDAVVAVDDQGVRTAALAAAALGLKTSDPEAVARTRDKAAMRRALAQAGVRSRTFRVAEPAGCRSASWPPSSASRSSSSRCRCPPAAASSAPTTPRGAARGRDAHPRDAPATPGDAAARRVVRPGRRGRGRGAAARRRRSSRSRSSTSPTRSTAPTSRRRSTSRRRACRRRRSTRSSAWRPRPPPRSG